MEGAAQSGPGGYAIRPATAADLDGLVRIERTAFDPVKYAGTLMSRRSFARHIAGGRNVVLVAEADDGQICGYALGLVRRGSPYLRFFSLAVLPEHAGRGIARRFFAGLEEFARRHGLRGVRLEFREDNPGLYERYLGYGYRVFARVPGYYADGCTAIRMVREL